MKKNAISIVVLVIVVSMLGLTGCQKLTLSNLKANNHLKKANTFYMDEKYRLAIDEYEEALALNPELKMTYLYLGTSYSQLYRPMKSDDRNKEYGDKAIEYLQKAYELDKTNENAIAALGDIYDKMSNFEEAVKYYLIILEKDKKKPQNYYILADFYAKYQKNEEAEDMYKQRIALDPRSPEGYHYYAGYMTNSNKWDRAIELYEKRLYALIDADIVILKNEIEQLQADIKTVEDLTKFIDTINKNKMVGADEKKRLIDETNQKLAGFKPLADLQAQLTAKTAEADQKIAGLDAKIPSLSEDIKKEVISAYYTIGVVCWTKSFRTEANLMAPQERMALLDKGKAYLDKVIKMDPENDMAYSFDALIWLQRKVADPLKTDFYTKQWQEASDKSKEIREKRLKRQQLQDQLEKMGEVK